MSKLIAWLTTCLFKGHYWAEVRKFNVATKSFELVGHECLNCGKEST